MSKSFHPRGAALALLGVMAAGIFTWLSLSARWRWERDNAVELCADGRELETLAAGDPAALTSALRRLSDAGVRSVALHWNGSEPPDYALKWEGLRPPAMSYTFRPEPILFGQQANVPARDLFSSARSSPWNVLPAGPVVRGFPDLEPFARWMESHDARLPVMEFSRQAGLGTLARRFPDRVIRAHAFDEEEMVRATPAKVQARFLRAVKERGIRFLYVRFFPGLSLESNLAAVESLAAALKRQGFEVGGANLRAAAWPWKSWSWRPASVPPRARQAAAFLAAVFLPVLCLGWALRPRPFAVSAVGLTCLDLAAALFVAACLSAPEFALGFEQFRGVKAALALPLVLAVLRLYPPDEIRSFLSRPVTFGAAACLLAAAGVLGVYLLRSGHGSPLDAGAAELRFREGLEGIFGVRPRFKEFAVGHPFLWLGLWLRGRRAGRVSPAGRGLFSDGRIFLIAGMAGQLSIINTFCHAHVPLKISLLRTFHGFWLGSLGGLALIAGARLLLPKSR